MREGEDFDFSGKSALVTGAGRGLGRAFALGLARAGADVAVTDIDAGTAGRTAEEIRALGRKALALRVDASIAADASAMVAEVLDAWGKLDVAVNNAGISLPLKEALAITEEEWDRQMDLNLRGTFFCAQAEARAMIPRRSGRIVNIASICGTIVWPEPQAVYSASKAGLIHLTRCLAAEWAPHGIRVNCVSPGVTRTPELFPQVIPVFLRKAPAGRIAETDDLVGAVLYLASNRADFLVGHNLVVDGGYTII
jgi:NAD(P)-dependent dehydrogenase (short-subunit alcohol dehydrogenase family)